MLAASIAPPSSDSPSERLNILVARRVPPLQAEPHVSPPVTHDLLIPPQPARADADFPTPSPTTMQERLQTFLSTNLRERVTLKDLSGLLGYSQKYCSEFFRLQMGMCFSHYVKNLRVTTATRMLGDHDLPLSHIANLLGFSDSFAFSHFFKRAVGCSPTEFRKQHIVHLGFR